jgi:coenzyme F420 biosynthesis associated uncharacterized protein
LVNNFEVLSGSLDSSPGIARIENLVSFDAARRVAVEVAHRLPRPLYYRGDELQRSFDELAPLAQETVARLTGLVVPTPARVVVMDRPRWAVANVSSFEALMGRIEIEVPVRWSSVVLAGTWQRFTKVMAGTEVGVLLGWISQRVLGQYDFLSGQGNDEVWFVGPNVVELEKRHGFSRGQFRLWLAIHEFTHRAQFQAVPWMQDYFLHLVQEGASMLRTDPAQALEGLKRALTEAKQGRNPFEEAGVIGALATPDQRVAIQKLQALMSILEGHGELVMNQAVSSVVPEAEVFHRVLTERRKQRSLLGKVFYQLIGLEAKLSQYSKGAAFLEELQKTGGRGLLDRLWESPEWMPSLSELNNPSAWLERVGVVPHH